MITIPTWLFILLIIMASPVALALIVFFLAMIFAPLIALKAASLADEKMREIEDAAWLSKNS